MKSPFPGMDPYLERHWRGAHHALVTYARDQLQTKLNDIGAALFQAYIFQPFDLQNELQQQQQPEQQ